MSLLVAVLVVFQLPRSLLHLENPFSSSRRVLHPLHATVEVSTNSAHSILRTNRFQPFVHQVDGLTVPISPGSMFPVSATESGTVDLLVLLALIPTKWLVAFLVVELRSTLVFGGRSVAFDP
jgi:hypothetical protein